MEPSQRAHVRRFLGGVVCGVLGILFFESRGPWHAVAGGIGGFALGALLPSLESIWRYLRSVPDPALDTVTFEREVMRRNRAVGMFGIGLIATMLVSAPFTASCLIADYLDDRADTIGPATHWLWFVLTTGLGALSLIMVLSTAIAISAFNSASRLAREHRFDRISTIPLVTFGARQTRHMFAWTIFCGCAIASLVPLYSVLIGIRARFAVPMLAVNLRQLILEMRRACAPYIVSVAAAVATMLAIAFSAGPYIHGRWFPWIALGAGVACGGMAWLAPVSISHRRYVAQREYLQRLRDSARAAFNHKVYMADTKFETRLKAALQSRFVPSGLKNVIDGDFAESINY